MRAMLRSPARWLAGAHPRGRRAAAGGARKGGGSEEPHVRSREAIASTPWLALEHLRYVDGKGKERGWDAVRRTTKAEGAEADAVAIFARLEYRDGRPAETLLVRQFRPPVNAYTLELPAGLIDAGESASEAALRELREETGYTATVASVSPPLSLSAGLTDETIQLVSCVVDVAAHPASAPCLEESESIEVLRVPLSDLPATLASRSASGDVVFAGLWCTALGLAAPP